MSYRYDLVIVGSGTTAIAGGLRAAGRGARVLLVEQSQVGGTCVNWGCIPSKTLIDKAATQQRAACGADFGLRLRVEAPDCERLMKAKRQAVETVRRERYMKALNQAASLEIRRGHARFISSRELQVGPDVLTCERFLVAAGGVPRTLQIPGLAEIPYLTSYSALHLSCFPASLIIIGGGVIALEMGQMFARFGTRVTIIERGERVLKDFDPRLTALFQEQLQAEGMTLLVGAETRAARQEEGEVVLEVAVEGRVEEVRAAQLMLAIGTAPATRDLGLEEAEVACDEGGFINTDEEMRTSSPRIWAAGDVTGPPLIAPAGALEAEVAVDNMFDPDGHRRIDHRQTPMAVFVDPEFAIVGRSAEDARAEGKAAVESWLPLEKVAKSHVLGRTRGGILLTAEPGSGRVLGVQMLAPRAADAIHEGALAVRFGLTVKDLADTVHVYPTISDGLRQAALDILRRQQP